MTKPPVLIELHYLPSIAWMAALASHDALYLEAQERFQKQTPRSRCEIMTPTGKRTLSIPIVHDTKSGIIQDIRIDYTQKWINDHWRAISSNYGKAPYFEYYAPDIEKILYTKHEYLFELNKTMLLYVMKCLKIKTEIIHTSFYQNALETDYFDLRSVLCSNDISKYYLPTPYTQVFGKEFVSNLSVIDVLMNKGPESYKIIKDSWRHS